MKPLLAVSLLLIVSMGFAQVLAQADVSAPSAGFDFSKDLFAKTVIESTSPEPSVEWAGSIDKATIQAGLFKLADVKMESRLGPQAQFKGRYVPIFTDCLGMTCEITYEITAAYDYSYVPGDFNPNLDIGSGKFNLIGVYRNFSQSFKVFDYGWVKHSLPSTGQYLDNLTGMMLPVLANYSTYEIVGSHLENSEAWTPIEGLTQKAGEAIKVRLLVSRDRMTSTADIQPRAYGSTVPQWGLYTSTRSQVRTFNLTNQNNHTANTSIFIIDNTTFNSSTGGALSGDWMGSCMDFVITTFRNDSTERDVNFTLMNLTGLSACDWANPGANLTGYINTTQTSGVGMEPGVSWKFNIYWKNTSAITTYAATNNIRKTFAVGDNFTVAASSDTAYWTLGSFGGAACADALNGTYEQLGVTGPAAGGWRGCWYQSVISMGANTSNPYYTIKINYSSWGTTGDYQSLFGLFDTATDQGQGIGYVLSSGTTISELNFKTCCTTNVVVNSTGGSYVAGSSYVGIYNVSQLSAAQRWMNASLNNRTTKSGTSGLVFPTGTNVGFTTKQDTNAGQGVWTKLAWIVGYNNLDNIKLTPLGAPGGALSVYLSPSSAFYNTMIEGLVNVGGSVNATAYNWTLYVNGTNYTSGNATNGTGFFPGVNASLFNLTHFSRGSNLTLSVQASLADGTNASYTNSSQLTISNTAVALTNLYMATNGTNYPNATLQANLTGEDNDTASDAINASYSWFKNGVNQTSLAGSIILQNGTAKLINLTLLDFTAGDLWFFQVQLNDSTAITKTFNTSNATIAAFLSNFSQNDTTPEFDLYSYQHWLNFTGSPGIQISASILYGSTSYAASCTNSSNIFNCSSILVPATIVNTPQNTTANWSINVSYQNGSSAIFNYAYNLTVDPSGFFLCNATYPTRTINYTIRDEETNLALNATMNSLYGFLTQSGAQKISNLSNTSTFDNVCISPFNAVIAANISDTLNASGYTSRVYNWPAQNYSNASINRTLYLLNTSNGVYYTFNVINQYNAPIGGAQLTLQKYLSASNTWAQVGTLQSDSLGNAIFFLQPASLYNLSVSAAGYIPANLSIVPGAQTTISIQLSSANTAPPLQNFDQIWNTTQYSVLPVGSYFNSSQTISFQVSSSNCSLALFGLVIIQNHTTVVYNATSSSACGGTLSYLANPTAYYTIQPFLQVQGFANYTVLPRQIYITNQTTGLAQIRLNLNANGAFSGWTYLFIALCIGIGAGLLCMRFGGGAAAFAGCAILVFAGVLAPASLMVYGPVSVQMAVALICIITAAVVYLTSYGV